MNFRKLLSVLLAIAMIMSIFTVMAFAEETLTVTLNDDEVTYELNYVNDDDVIENHAVYMVADGLYQDTAQYETSGSHALYITNLNGLKTFRDLSNGVNAVVTAYVEQYYPSVTAKSFYSNHIFANYTIHLLADIDLDGLDWKPIGSYVCANSDIAGVSNDQMRLHGIFDGHNHVVSNLTVTTANYYTSKYSYYGFFGATCGGSAIKNLTLNNVSITANKPRAGAFSGHNVGMTTFENCHLTGKVEISSSYSFVGAFAGYGQLNIKDCSIEADDDSYISAYYHVGGVTGFLSANSVVDNVTVKNIKIESTYDDAYSGTAAIAGFYAANSNTIKNCTVEDVEVVTPVEDDIYAGILVGRENETRTNYLTVLDNTIINSTFNGDSGDVLYGKASADYVVVGRNVEYEGEETAPNGKFKSGIFASIPDALIAENYAKAPNIDAETKDSYPYTLKFSYVAEETVAADDVSEVNNTISTVIYTEKEDGTIVDEDVTVTLDNTAVESIKADYASRTLKLVVTSDVAPTEEQEEVVASSDKAFEITIVDADTNEPVVFEGTATVEIPYSGEEEGKYAVYYVATNGSMEKMKSSYDHANSVISFSTSHFSTYIVLSSADITENVTVGFKKTAEDNVYDIVLTASDSEKFINELASADLVFKLDVTSGNIVYEVEAKDGVTLTSEDNRYMFNFDGNTEYEESGAEITIGKVTFSGYGDFSFVLDESAADAHKDIVNATEFDDNIVKTYSVLGGTLAKSAKPDVNNDSDEGTVGGKINDTLRETTAAVEVEIEFNNPITAGNSADYDDMTVTLTGSNGETYTGKVGSGSDADIVYADDANKVTFVFDSVVVGDNGYTYTVTVKGAGYRTARQTKLVSGDITYTFWNNVKDASGANFLAGDIVKDNNINIYDLSAVVSYFGTENLVSEHPEYAKYDLNRDGVIDSKDVAYVLVSWNN